ncbi:hypothetical protein DS831_04780 [Bombilactobacillus bombi]|uniref:Uncharacterized protein n=1 Tax=Bombilactobacillus bombi TaxID=1303590 RepID=A0A417ZIB7_9LACO|nr:hypothetical protein [Bombilactobacillus bombi]RHW51340.1 hypothetical protein DS831_04780 [Bombilactobacillus bombi]
MRKLTNDEKKLLSQLMKESYYGDVKLQQLEEVTASHTTNSYYLAFSDEKGEVYQIAFSDHKAFSHNDEIIDLDVEDPDELIDQLVTSFNLKQNHTNYLLAPDIDLEFFGIQKADKFKIDPTDLIGKKSYNRAWVSSNFEITNAKLECNNQILVCDYDGEVETYVNYNPVEGCESKSDEDFILADYLHKNEIKRSLVYKYYVTSINDYCNDYPMMSNGEITSEQAKKEKLWLEDEEFVDEIDGYLIVMYQKDAEDPNKYDSEDEFGDDYY